MLIGFLGRGLGSGGASHFTITKTIGIFQECGSTGSVDALLRGRRHGRHHFIGGAVRVRVEGQRPVRGGRCAPHGSEGLGRGVAETLRQGMKVRGRDERETGTSLKPICIESLFRSRGKQIIFLRRMWGDIARRMLSEMGPKEMDDRPT